jgi:anti-sigma B factor antagonist
MVIANGSVTVILHAAGEVDSATVPQLRDSVTRALGCRPQALIVDLTEVRFLGSAGLAALVEAHEQAGEFTQVRVVAPGRATLHPMRLTRFAEEFTIYPSLPSALAGL